MTDRPKMMKTAGEGATAREALEAFAHGLRDDEVPLMLRLRRGRVEAHGRRSAYDGFVAERVGRGGDLTFDEMVVACRNVGVDLTCGACAAVFYTGIGADGHTCDPKPADLPEATVREYDCGDGVRLVLDYDGTFERNGWFFSHWHWKPMPEAVKALWSLPAWSAPADALAALNAWRRSKNTIKCP